jgi:3-ketosteroid 9alpha-monooxygenase subunit A
MSVAFARVGGRDGDRPPERYARGWHCLGLAAPFKDGKPHTIEIFGSKLVVFQQADGSMAVLDGYCPHMGADLGTGTLIDGNVACAFHGWQWDGQGHCARVPYSPRVPRKAVMKSWPVCEQNQQLFVYNDPEENPPPPEVAIPRIDAVMNGECLPWEWSNIVIPTNCRELIDNAADATHFYYVHGWSVNRFVNIFDRHMATQNAWFAARKDVNFGEVETSEADFSFSSSATYYGPAYMIVNQTADYLGKPVELFLINAHYPITPNSFMLHAGVTTKRVPGVSEEESIALGRSFGKAAVDAFFQDVELWKRKTRVNNPILSEYDGPVYQLRRWYQQFYVNAGDVTPEMTARFEHDMDLTVPLELWKKDQERIAATR